MPAAVFRLSVWHRLCGHYVCFGFLLRFRLRFDRAHCIPCPIRDRFLEYHAAGHGEHAGLVRPCSISHDDTEAELQGIGKGCDPLRASWILAHYNRLLPVRNVVFDPARYEWLRDEIVHRALEEALHLTGMEIDRYDMVNARDVEEVRNHARCNGTSVRFLL